MEEFEEDEIADIFVGVEIIFHFKKEGVAIDEKAIAAVLEKHEQKPKGKIREDETYIL